MRVKVRLLREVGGFVYEGIEFRRHCVLGKLFDCLPMKKNFGMAI